jgi:hypothetical protein
MAIKSRIKRIDELLREQYSDIVKLTADKDGLQMDDFKGHMTRKLTVLFFSLIRKIIENCRVTSLIDFCFLASF